MDRQVRRKLAMGASVRTFSRAHPSADTSYTLVLDRLDGTIVRIEELAKQQEGGYASKHAAAVRRSDLRRRLQGGLLRHLVTVAEDVGSEASGIGERFRLPRGNTTHSAFRARASEMLDQARANQEILVKHGMSATLLDELDAAIKEFDGSLAETDDGKQSHVAARAEMKALGDEIMRLVGMLDGFNRYRFHRDPELIVAWESAKRIVSGPEPRPEAEAEKPAA
jgi:hypothetical protein